MKKKPQNYQTYAEASKNRRSNEATIHDNDGYKNIKLKKRKERKLKKDFWERLLRW